MGPHMGSGLMRRPPQYVHAYIDRTGKPRFYFRQHGFKRVPLPGLPWSPEFMAAYEAAMTTQAAPIGANRSKPGTMAALAASYYQSLEFTALRSSTKKTYRSIIDPFLREHGDKRAATLQREHIVRLMAERALRPDSANGLRKVLRCMMRHAVAIGMRADDPTRDVRKIRVQGSGYHSWTEAEIEQFESVHPIGSRARLAFALLLHTGQRRADIVRMGRQHIRDGTLHVTQEKTGARLEIPVSNQLACVLDSLPSAQLTFLITRYGGPFNPIAFSTWFRDQCDRAGLRHCSAHGLRKAAARRLAEAGCSTHEIGSITGHASLKEIGRYTAAADQRRLARSAMNKIRTSSG